MEPTCPTCGAKKLHVVAYLFPEDSPHRCENGHEFTALIFMSDPSRAGIRGTAAEATP